MSVSSSKTPGRKAKVGGKHPGRGRRASGAGRRGGADRAGSAKKVATPSPRPRAGRGPGKDVDAERLAGQRRDEMLASEPLTRSVFEQAADSIVLCDESGRILRASDAAIELCAGNPLMAPFAQAFPLELSGAPRGGPTVVAQAMSGKDVRAAAATLRRADGSTVDLLVNAKRIRGTGRRLVGCVVTLADVSQRRRTEEALHEKETLLQSFFDSADILRGIVEIAVEDVLFISVNTAAAGLYGRPPGEIVGQWASALGVPADIVAFWLERYRESQRRNEVVRFEILRPVGDQQLWFSAFVTFLGIGPAGRPRFAYVMIDVTEHKRAEQALQDMKRELELRVRERTAELAGAMTALERERRRFHDVLEMLPAYVILLSPDYRVPMANRFFEERFGKSEGRRCYEYLFGRTTPCESCESFKSLETGKPHRWEWTGPDGRDYDIYDFPFSDADGSPLVMEMGLDVTDKKRAEAAAQRERKRLFDVLETLPAMICLLTPDHRVAFGNRSFRERFGEPGGRHCHEQCFGRPAPCEFCESYRVFETGRPHRWELQVPGGDTVIEASAFPFADVDGSPLILEMKVDITERKRTEAALRDLNDTLERRVAERTAELQRANQQLEESDHRKNDFLAVLSHELRNPLMPISNSLYVLKHATPGGEQAGKAIEVIGRQVGYLSHLVNDLLDLTRVARNKIQLQREPTDLRDIVRRSVEDQRSLFDAGGVRLDVTLPTAPVLVDADATRLAQVVGNLLQNAAKFTRRGGGTSVALTRDQAHGQAIVRVRDSGVGMAPETIAMLFQPFVQAEQTLDRTKGGLGLGLALVKGLVELHGGEVSARSEGLGRGSEFMVRLPLDDRTGAQPQPSAPSRPARTRRVLIIEDNHDAAVSLREALELDGHEVQVAHDGREGVALALAFLPEVVLCDIGLPQMDGYQVARALRAEGHCQDALLVALSGYALPEDQQRAVDAGFDRHLAKPPSLEMLKEILAHAPYEASDSQSITAPMPLESGR